MHSASHRIGDVAVFLESPERAPEPVIRNGTSALAASGLEQLLADAIGCTWAAAEGADVAGGMFKKPAPQRTQ